MKTPISLNEANRRMGMPEIDDPRYDVDHRPVSQEERQKVLDVANEELNKMGLQASWNEAEKKIEIQLQDGA